MPYKDPIKAKEQKERYYAVHKEKMKKRATDWYAKNKEKVLKAHSENSDILKEKSRDWRKKNKARIKVYKKSTDKKYTASKNKRNRKATAELKNYYIVTRLKQETKLTREQIKKHPELIENKKQELKVKRLIKNKKHQHGRTKS